MIARPGPASSTRCGCLNLGVPHTYHHGDFPTARCSRPRHAGARSRCAFPPATRAPPWARWSGGRPALPGRARGQRAGRRGDRARRRLARRHGRAGPDAGASGWPGPRGGRRRQGPGHGRRAGRLPGDVVAFLDADVANTTPAFVTGLLGPLLTTDPWHLVKGFYTRPLHGDPTGGGRVTELVARPVLELLFPELSWVRQPLAGETAAHRWVFEKLGFAGGYGVELGLLIDVAQQLGADPWPRSTWASASTATGRCTSCAPRRSTCCGRPSSASPRRRAAVERAVERQPRRLQPRPAHLPRRARRRAGPGARRRRAGLLPAPAPRGERHDVGLGDDGGGGPRGGRPRPHARGRARSAPRGHRRRDLPAGLRRRRQHDAVVLPSSPLRPAAPAPLRPPLAGGVGGLPGLQPCHGRRRGGPGRRGRRRLRAGLPLLAARADAGRGAPGPAHGALLHTPFAAPDMLGVLPDDVRAELLDGMAGYSACGFHCHQWEAGFLACYAAAGTRRGRARRRSWRRSAPTPACSRRRRPSPECAAAAAALRAERWAGAGLSRAPTAWSPRRTSCGGCSPSRNC
jgi:hypothetical protein